MQYQSTHLTIPGSCSIRKGSDFTGLAWLLLHVNSVGLGLGQLFIGQISDRKTTSHWEKHQSGAELAGRAGKPKTRMRQVEYTASRIML